MAWKKGQSGNPNGRPKRSEIDELRKAIAKVQKDEDHSVLEHFVRRAYKNDKVLIALVKKFVPDKTKIDGEFMGVIQVISAVPRPDKEG